MIFKTHNSSPIAGLKTYQNLTIILFFCLLQSCIAYVGGRVSGGNEAFEKKYSREIKQLTKERSDQNKKKPDMKNYQVPDGQKDISQAQNPENNFAYQEIVKFGNPKILQRFFPDSETYEQATQSGVINKLPPDIFEISYNTRLSPPFKRLGQEFDKIQIPSADVYGISSSNNEKSYLLASRSSIQKAISIIKSQRANEGGSQNQIINQQTQPFNAAKSNDEINVSELISLPNQNSEKEINSKSLRNPIKKTKKLHKNKTSRKALRKAASSKKN